jgi:hypothetical protein
VQLSHCFSSELDVIEWLGSRSGCLYLQEQTAWYLFIMIGLEAILDVTVMTLSRTELAVKTDILTLY